MSAWAAVGLAAFLAAATAIQGFAVTKYKADQFEKQATVYRNELIDFQKMYKEDQRRTSDQLSVLSNAVARIEQALDVPCKLKY
jgi:hypothetical protein